MKQLLTLLLCAVSLCAFSQEEEEELRQPVRWELIPCTFGRSYITSARSEKLPWGADRLYDDHRRFPPNGDLFSLRVLFNDRIVVGAKVSLSGAKTDTERLLADLRSDFPNHFIQNERPSHYVLAGGSFFGGWHFRLKNKWAFETLLSYRLQSADMPGMRVVFKEYQSNTYCINDFRPVRGLSQGIGLECNLMRYFTTRNNTRFFAGAQLAYTHDWLPHKGLLKQTDHLGNETQVEYTIAKQLNAYAAAVFVGVHLGRRGML